MEEAVSMPMEPIARSTGEPVQMEVTIDPPIEP